MVDFSVLRVGNQNLCYWICGCLDVAQNHIQQLMVFGYKKVWFWITVVQDHNRLLTLFHFGESPAQQNRNNLDLSFRT
ncbi:hypothetical protein L6452_33464 [Arctium lappa]|uniref:Uncharacterized protein n=1 Tax=Arctium lappa TaxID=4217 RepID=A0ACB8YGF3_ARCLA|nr:hypothetical protein L6452_33464 [Arctium lappa]